MSKTSRTVITMPDKAKRGEIIEIRAIAQHDMETGFRYDQNGKRCLLYTSPSPRD